MLVLDSGRQWHRIEFQFYRLLLSRPSGPAFHKHGHRAGFQMPGGGVLDQLSRESSEIWEYHSVVFCIQVSLFSADSHTRLAFRSLSLKDTESTGGSCLYAAILAKADVLCICSMLCLVSS